jgi:hypothetical protein
MSGDGVVQSFQRQVRRPAERRALPSPVITACHLSKEYRSTMGRRRTGCASTVTTVSREWQLQLAMRRKAHSRKPIAERSILRRVVLASGQSKGGLRAPRILSSTLRARLDWRKAATRNRPFLVGCCPMRRAERGALRTVEIRHTSSTCALTSQGHLVSRA